MKKDLVKTVKIISSFLVLSMGLSGCTLPDSSVSEPQVEVHFADEIEPPTLLGQYPVEPQEDEFLDEVPEYISDRGIILRGPLRDPESPKLITFHTDTNGNGIWISDYTCDCDLAIAGSDQEFTDFLTGNSIIRPNITAAFSAFNMAGMHHKLISDRYSGRAFMVVVCREALFTWMEIRVSRSRYFMIPAGNTCFF